METKIGLAEMINTLRLELEQAEINSNGAGIVFEAEKVELELQVALENAKTAGGGIKFWVVNINGDMEQSQATTHTFKLTLKPVSRNTRQPIDVNQATSIPPSEQ